MVFMEDERTLIIMHEITFKQIVTKAEEVMLTLQEEV
jgi:hypothetical protein